MNQNIYINEIPSAELTIYDNGTPVTVVIANGTVSQNKVPYTGATQNVNLGEYGISAGFVQLDTTPTTYTPAIGNMGWNDSEGTIDLLLKGGVVSLPLGQKQVARIVNGTGGNVLKSNYQVVKVTGAQGQRLQVNLAQANNDANSADTLGLIAENINNNNSGFIITSGLVENINTTGSLQSETWADGNVLYLSPTTPGAITNVKPQAPNHTVIVGFVVYAHANNGKIFVKVDNGYELDELHNVLINTGTLANGQVLKYNSSLQVWENNSDAGITGSGTSGQVAYWSGTTTQTGSNNLFWDNANGRLGIGTTSPVSALHIGTSTGSLATGITLGSGNSGFWLLNSTTLGIKINNVDRFWFRSTDFYPDATLSLDLGLSSRRWKTFYSQQITDNGSNVLIGTTTDAGQKLQVTGDTLLKGSGNTSGTTALTVQNSDGTNLFRVINDSLIRIGNSSNGVVLFAQAEAGTNANTSGTNISFFSYTTTQLTTNGRYFFGGSTGTQTSGNQRFIVSLNTFAPTSGTATHDSLLISQTINQTGGANGITRGLYVNPTLTSAADWRSVEWSNNTGWGLYGAGTANNYLAGSLNIGGTSLTGYNLRLQKSITGAANSFAISQSGLVASTVSSAYGYYNISNTQAASFTLTSYDHFRSDQGTIGLGSSITNQTGFRADSTLTGATNNYGFYGDIASGTGRWNLYMNGTALNYLNGSLLVGTTTDAGFKLDVNGTARVQGALTISTGGASIAGTTSLNGALYTNGALAINPISGQTRIATLGNIEFVTNNSPGWTGQGFSCAGGNRTLTMIGSGSLNALDDSKFSFITGGANWTRTSGISRNILISDSSFAPTSGTSTYYGLELQSIINQTGGANGITRGLYVNPTLTAAADWRSIETSNNTGYALYLGGSADAFFNDATDFQFGTTTGTKIGTATSQKLGFWNATPIVQPTTGVASATRVGGGGTTLTDTDTFDGYTLAQIVKALRNTGILA